VRGQKHNRNIEVPTYCGGSCNTTNLAIQLNIHEHKIGAIVFGSAECLGSSARVTGDFVAEFHEFVFER
jgi:hypothetical protein